jgi:acyl-CoA thioester hydrolase
VRNVSDPKVGTGTRTGADAGTNTGSETRERFRYWLKLQTRWMDNDQYGHVNNAQYYSYIDSIVNKMLFERQVLAGPHWNAIGLVVASSCEFFSPLSFPQEVDCGLRIGKIGNTSLLYQVGIFGAGIANPSALGQFTHVFVDPQTRRPVPLAPKVREAMQSLIVAD